MSAVSGIKSTLSRAPIDLNSMEASDASKDLYAQIQWEELCKAGVFFSHQDHQMIERAQLDLSTLLDQPAEAQTFVKKLIMIAENCTTNLTIQQYVFTRVMEILGLGVGSAEDAQSGAFGLKHAKLFLNAAGDSLADACFSRALTFSDSYLQKSASLCYAALLGVHSGNMASLVSWISAKLASTSNGIWDMSLPALTALTRSPTARAFLVKSGIINTVVNILKRIGVNGNSQHIYDLVFVLWSVSLTEVDPQPYLISGVVPVLLEFLAAASSKKVIRMIVFTLKNLVVLENEKLLNELFASGILRMVENLTASQAIKHLEDQDADADFRVMQDILSKNSREMSSFERWSSEINSGALRWGILHTEKFWKENARSMEKSDFSSLKALLSLLTSSDASVVSIALYDIGEFVRFYPNGRVVVSRLGGKEAIMKLISHDDPEIQRHALQCVSKLMITNWEHLR